MRTVIIILLINFASNAWANNVVSGSEGSRLEAKVVSEFNRPWAMSFINSDNLIITTKAGKLWVVNMYVCLWVVYAMKQKLEDTEKHILVPCRGV